MYSASVKLELGKEAKEYFVLLDKKLNYKRSKVSVKLSKNTLIIQVRANDPVALVASINSVLKQIRIIGNAEKLFD
ncbi:MAG: hypothetical protein KGH54_03070 [Candidatus Micrarchaeota archaeon]|nr:hypothetical protein [Candidatus Micrarchaeota archaeon]